MRIASLAMSIAVALFSGSLAQSAAAKEPLTLAPVGDWRISSSDISCKAVRNFGNGEDRTTLTLEQEGAEPHYKMTLVGQPLRNPYGAGIRVQFGPDEEPSTRSFISAKSGSGKPALVMFSVHLSPPDVTEETSWVPVQISAEREAAIDQLLFSAALNNPLTLELGPMGDIFAGLRKCGKDLAATLKWNSRLAGGDSSTAFPIGQGKWIPPEVYPRYLIQSDIGATLRVRLTVGTNGRAKACYIEQSSRPQLFEDTLCLALMRNARFKPARDSSGEPVVSYYHFRASFSVR